MEGDRGNDNLYGGKDNDESDGEETMTVVTASKGQTRLKIVKK